MTDQKQEQNGSNIDACPSALTPSVREAVFHGVSAKSSRCRLKVGNVPMFGRGQMFAVAASGKWEQWPNESGIESNTSCWAAGPVEILDCVHHETGRPMRFVGHLEANHTSGVLINAIAGAGRPAATGQHMAEPSSESAPAAHTRCIKGNESFEAELAHLTQLRNQGFDPTLKLPFIKAYTGKSHSTIYREIARGRFPPPIRHGKSVSWLLSHVDAYRLGNWMRPTDMTAAGHEPVKTECASPKPRTARKHVDVGSHH